MRLPRTRRTGSCLAASVLAFCQLNSAALADPPTFETYAQLTECPGNIAATADGRVFISIHQFMPSKNRVVEIAKDRSLKPFPNEAWNRGDAAADTLDSVLGIRADSRGVVWMLDNGMRGKVTPKIVAWDTKANRLSRVIYLPPPVTAANSFVNDLQIDESTGSVYIADPAGGANAAIIVVDLATGLARRVLEGDRCVTPEELDLTIDGAPVELTQPDGKKIRPRVGVNPLALDAKSEWLYLGAMTGSKLYRVKTADLRDTALTTADLSKRVEVYADRPITDGISIDNAGNIYLGSLPDNAIGVIGTDRKYRVLMQDDRVSWPDAFCFAPDGRVLVVLNQLHRTAPLNGGQNRTVPPFLIGAFQPLAAGVVGR